MGVVSARDRIVPRARRRRVFQARQHRLQAKRSRAGQCALAARARAEPQARTRQSQSGYPEQPLVTAAGTDERAFQALTQKISKARGLSCESYKDKCLKRRIGVRMRARGVHTYDDYSRLLDSDAREYQELLDALTINVTKFFRNLETWDALQPHLRRLGAAQPDLRIWSAGCASGEEPYTIAVLVLDTLGEAAGGRAIIDATDIDRLSLERTREAKYPDAAFTEMPAQLKLRYFRDDQPLPLVRELVHVRAHDLMRERPPRPPYHLIVCRNVVIYFERQAQERLFQVFVDALAPGGVLLLGKVETLFGPARERLRLVDPRERIYTKPPPA
ncbi:MAG: chemotaxis protein CheR [Gemmatimonadetes bacterium]|nr:MAG: chemotaxis protein CheR [Gemmatimonadota bacterium]